VTGEVLSIDLLSVKLRTFDNLLVRIPNENIIKERLTNLTAFPIRRVELKEAFDEAGIEIPFPHRTLYAGSVTDPFPVRVVDSSEGCPPVDSPRRHHPPNR
jgi:small-conductance mechanosensitive channel